MGRPKLILKPIPYGRDRDLALTKRKKALMNKMSEFSNVCGVNGCLIIYDDNGDTPPLTWPQDPNVVHSIITRYESTKHEKLPKNFDLNNFFQTKKNMADLEISKIHKEIIKIRYPTWHPSFSNLGVKQLKSFIARLDNKLEDCNQRIVMSRQKLQNQANFNSMQCMVQPESAVSNPSQLNFMQENSQNQLMLPPMVPLNYGNNVACYQQNHDKGSSSQSQMPYFDPNLMQLMAMNKGVLASTNQVGVPLDYANQSDAVGNSTNQLDVHLDFINQLDESLNIISQLDEVVNWSSQPGEFINWTNQHGVPVIGGSCTAMNGATTYDTKLQGVKHHPDWK